MPLLPLSIARKPLNLGLTPGPVATRTSGGTSEYLPLERAKASFQVERMMNIFDGGKEQTKRRKWIQSYTNEYVPFVIKDVEREEVIAEHLTHFMQMHNSVSFCVKGVGLRMLLGGMPDDGLCQRIKTWILCECLIPLVFCVVGVGWSRFDGVKGWVDKAGMDSGLCQ